MKRVLTNNDSAYKSRMFAQVCDTYIPYPQSNMFLGEPFLHMYSLRSIAVPKTRAIPLYLNS